MLPYPTIVLPCPTTVLPCPSTVLPCPTIVLPCPTTVLPCIGTTSPAQAGTGTEDVNEDNDFSALDSEDKNVHANSTAALSNGDPSFTNSEK